MKREDRTKWLIKSSVECGLDRMIRFRHTLWRDNDSHILLSLMNRYNTREQIQRYLGDKDGT